MKIVVISDIYIDGEVILNAFEKKHLKGAEVSTVQWMLASQSDLQKVNLIVEQGGSEMFEVPDYIIDAVKGAECVVTQFCPVNKKMIDACPNLKIIGTVRAGMENINCEYAKEKRIRVVNNAGRNANAVADFTVGMLLSECRNIAKAHASIVNGGWQREFANSGLVPDLANKTVGVIGVGQIGSKVAQRLKAFDAHVICYDPYCCNANAEFEFMDLDALLREADFITIHMRLTKATEHMIGRDEIAKMKPTTYIVNTARSGLIDEKALVEALQQRKIMGAALDVFDE
ncbi:MAG: NAD(P)-dependent oxidoreductase [Clostridia bacterium]